MPEAKKNKRLLTSDEILNIKSWLRTRTTEDSEASLTDLCQAIAFQQDNKTYAKTLKEFGEWLEKRKQDKIKRRKEVLYEPLKTALSAEIAELDFLIFTLKRGELPE